MMLFSVAWLLAAAAAQSPTDAALVPSGDCRCTGDFYSPSGKDFAHAKDIKSLPVPADDAAQSCCELCAANPLCKMFVKTELNKVGRAHAGRAGGSVSAAFRSDAQYCHSDDEASWAFVVGCSALLIFYIGGGVVMGARQGKTHSLQAYPHYAYLHGLLGLIVDGVAFSRQKLGGGGGYGGGRYNAGAAAGAAGSAASTRRWPKGERAEYKSSKGWIAATLRRDGGGARLDLDCQQKAARDKVRALPAADTAEKVKTAAKKGQPKRDGAYSTPASVYKTTLLLMGLLGAASSAASAAPPPAPTSCPALHGVPTQLESACAAGKPPSTGCLFCNGTVCTGSVAADTTPPLIPPQGAPPAAMQRVIQVAKGWERTSVYHTLLLPRGEKPRNGWPVLVELPGNYCGPGGGAVMPNSSGDDCDGSWSAQGWGAGADTGDYIWLTLPFVTADLGGASDVSMWYWGCANSTKAGCDGYKAGAGYNSSSTLRYLHDTIQQTAAYGGDARRVVLLGHSRGAIATQAIGFANAQVAQLWAGVVAASHYEAPCDEKTSGRDGHNCENWPYWDSSGSGGGVAGAIARAKRAERVPKFIVGECDLATRVAVGWLRDVANVSLANVTSVASGFRDHTNYWILRPSAARTKLRAWLAALMKSDDDHAVDPALPARWLLAEFMPSPSVVDTVAPRFSWHGTTAAGARGVTQAAFQLQVCAVVQTTRRWDGRTWECDENCAAAGNGRASPCAWDSGRVNSSTNSGVEYRSIQQALQSDSAYGWRVKWWAHSAGGESEAAWSAVARMDTAFIGGAAAFPGGARWIGLAPSAFAAAPLGTTLLRTTFALPAGAAVTRARAYVASPGYYNLCVDGRSVDEDRVLGAFTVFTRKILYDAFDVTRLLTLADEDDSRSGGQHALAITLANGWYSQPKINLGPRMVMVELRIDYAVATASGPHSGTIAVVSDGSWRETHGPETSNDFYLGVTHDARQETPGWLLANYTETSAAAGRWGAAAVLPSPLLPGGAGTLRAAAMPPVRRCESFTPRTVKWRAASAENPAGWVVDFGQNMAGTVKLTIPRSVLDAAGAGTNVTMRHAEMTRPNGSLHHLYGAEDREWTTFVLGSAEGTGAGGGDVVFEPRFTYSGFRYVLISGSALAGAAVGGPLPVSVLAHFVHTDMERNGRLSTSSALLNKIVKAAEYSQLSNWMSLPTDCDQRERRGWIGDAQLGSEGVMHTAFAPGSYAKFLSDISDSQLDEDAAGRNGNVPEVCPNYGHAPNTTDPPFGVGYAVILWNSYRYYGDKRLLAKHYGGVKAFAETLVVRAGGGGARAGVLNHSTSTHGDWVSVANKTAGATTCSGKAALDHYANATCCRFMECPDPVVNGFYYVEMFRILAAAADVLGHAADASRYEALASDAASSLAAAEYRAADRKLGYGYMADQAMGLALGSPGGVLPAGDVAAVAAGLAADVAQQGGHLDTGMFGTKILLPTLSSTGFGDTAIGVLTQTTAPSWGAWITQYNATTLYEMWGAFSDVGGPKGVASHNHGWAASFLPWLYQTLVGISMDDDDYGTGVLLSSRAGSSLPTGYVRFRVAPRLLGELPAASATMVTARGNISVSWSRTSTVVWLNVSIPVGADTAVTVPLPRGGSPGCRPVRATVHEGAQLVWQRGKFKAGVRGISGAKAATTAGLSGVEVTTGSGSYRFSAAC